MITPLYMMWILHLQSVYYLDYHLLIFHQRKEKSCDDFSTSIKNELDGEMRRLANLSIVRDKFSVFGEMISEALKYLSPSQHIYIRIKTYII